jgi:hypothetical protein
MKTATKQTKKMETCPGCGYEFYNLKAHRCLGQRREPMVLPVAQAGVV